MTETAQDVVRQAAMFHASRLRVMAADKRLEPAKRDYCLQRADTIDRALSVDCKAHRCGLPVPGQATDVDSGPRTP